MLYCSYEDCYWSCIAVALWSGDVLQTTSNNSVLGSAGYDIVEPTSRTLMFLCQLHAVATLLSFISAVVFVSFSGSQGEISMQKHKETATDDSSTFFIILLLVTLSVFVNIYFFL